MWVKITVSDLNKKIWKAKYDKVKKREAERWYVDLWAIEVEKPIPKIEPIEELMDKKIDDVYIIDEYFLNKCKTVEEYFDIIWIEFSSKKYLKLINHYGLFLPKLYWLPFSATCMWTLLGKMKEWSFKEIIEILNN